MKALLSILILAYNAEECIGYSLNSALARTEITVMGDGSRDRTAEIVRRSTSNQVCGRVQTEPACCGYSNHALQLSQGDYIQRWDARMISWCVPDFWRFS